MACSCGCRLVVLRSFEITADKRNTFSALEQLRNHEMHHLDEVTAAVVDIVQGVKAEQVSQDFSDRKRALNFGEEFRETADHVLHVISLQKCNFIT